MEDFQDLMGGKKNVLSETNKQQLQEFEKMQKDLRAKQKPKPNQEDEDFDDELQD